MPSAVEALDSDVEFLDISPDARLTNRFQVPTPPPEPRSRRIPYSAFCGADKERERERERDEPKRDGAWLNSLCAAGIPVCLQCGARNHLDAGRCEQCGQPLAWKRTRRLPREIGERAPSARWSGRRQPARDDDAGRALKLLIMAQLWLAAGVLGLGLASGNPLLVW